MASDSGFEARRRSTPGTPRAPGARLFLLAACVLAAQREAVEEAMKRLQAEKLEETTKQKPGLPPEVVSAGDFPRSIRIPGSSAAIKFGGSVWVSAVNTMDALGSDDRFITWTIPVAGDPGAEKGPRTSFWANPSSLNFDVRTKGPGERAVRAFVEGDFAGASSCFRLRHAHVQVGGFLAGQTWSTFSDPDASHGDIDFEGVNGENVPRQAQFRFTRRLSRPDEVDDETGWGLSASGTLTELPWAPGDVVTFQVNGGRGIARFIGDLNSAGGQDGAFDPATGELVLLSQVGWYGSYVHRWLGSAREPGYLRSGLVRGTVHVGNLDFQPTNAYKRTHRLSLNLVWTPIRNGDLGVQYIWGQRVNRDGASGEARQLQVRARYVF